MGPLLALGSQRPLQEEDLGELAFMDRAGSVGSRLAAAIGDEKALPKESRSMWRAYRKTYTGIMIYPMVCKLVGDLLGFVQVSRCVSARRDGGCSVVAGSGLRQVASGSARCARFPACLCGGGCPRVPAPSRLLPLSFGPFPSRLLSRSPSR